MAFRIFLILFGVFYQPLEAKLSSVHFSDCGDANKSMAISTDSTMIEHPAHVSVFLNLLVLKDLPPTNFEMQVHLTKMTPKRMYIPCHYPTGSCAYDVCNMIELFKDYISPQFPHPYACPVKAAPYKLRIAVPFREDGEKFIDEFKGSYEINTTFIDKSSNTEVACIALTFKIVPSKKKN